MARVLIPLAQGCEELEAVTLIDLLRRAEIEVVTAGLDEQPVTGALGVVLIPDTSIEAVLNDTFDMIVLPGGLPGADHLDDDPRIHTLIKAMAKKGGYTAAICAAPKILANAGLLDGKQATSYPGFLDKMDLTQVDVVAKPVVVDGKIITSRGPGTALDFALELIETLAGRETREQVEAALMRP